MSCGFLQKLSQNLLEILDDEEYYDITIEVGNDPHVTIFRAHMVILNYRSSYLRRILSTNKKKNDDTLIQIKLPNILPEIFQIILRYIYGGEPSLKDCDNLDIIKILVTASELNLEELVIYIQSFLIKYKASWMEQNFNLIYETSFENDSLLELQKYCTDLVSKNPEKIFKSLELSSVSEKLLILLIQNDNLQMSEIKVWEKVLKWGIAQNPGLSSDPSNYSKNDFNSLKNTLQKCIPFIRFYDLTSKEFLDGVLPYREILPDQLYMDLLKTFLSLHPNSKPTHKSNPRNRIVKEVLPNSLTIDEFNTDQAPDSWDKPRQTASPSKNVDDLLDYLFSTNQASEWNKPRQPGCDKPRQTASILNSMDQDCISWNKQHQTASVLNIMDQDCSWGKQHQSAINMEVDDSWDKPRQTATVLNNMDQDYRDKPHQIATIYNSMDQDCSWNKPRQTAKSVDQAFWHSWNSWNHRDQY
ncbi:hypothetical protein RclHR1_17480001 [Rhizophagus clarus]|uniref:BTB domain-containing protein n=1 Tax=Rhizophagus clarus TaxID=94130 RepID=A0A2Z6RDA0_9GLOM|nr:hypothetical protein RclHR1_17480001 [Rhizophagus clarus]